MSAASRNAPRLDVCELDGFVLGRLQPGRREPGGHDVLGPREAGRRVSAVVDVRTLQSLRIVLPPLVDGREPMTGHPGPAVPSPRRARHATPTRDRVRLPDAAATPVGERREPAFDELVRGPGPQPAGTVATARLSLLARLALRARLVSPRRPAARAAGRR